ncbi:MAG: hypothetical protein AB7O98_04130 [Hyphomonadaceae bacterium]
MRLALALGAAFAALTVAAATAQTTRVIVRHGGGEHPALSIDANEDGWVSRDEASAAADRMFDHMDRNDDGRLTSEDRAAMFEDVHIRVDGPEVEVLEGEDGERRVRVIRREVEREVEEAMREAERATRDAEREVREAQRDARRAERDARRAAREARDEDGHERHVERVIIIRGGEGEWEDMEGMVHPVPPTPPVAPVAPVPPHPPMFMMLIANSEEADLNGDGALSREEFRAQHLRFFDASDANGDGRVRFEEPPLPPEPPAPPEAPEAPTPPAPPRR